MRSEFEYTGVYNQWRRKFAAAASADKHAELLRPLKHLNLRCSAANVLAGTNLLVRAVMGYCQMDGRECKSFLKQQRYRPESVDGIEYCLIFELADDLFGRILTDSNFTFVDLADLFDHVWSEFSTIGFESVYITRLDGKPIRKKELNLLHDHVMADMYNDRAEEEVSLDVYMSEFEDTAQVYAAENCDEDGSLLSLPSIRSAAFITKFGR